MATEYLLDTDTVVHLFHNQPNDRSRMARHRPAFLPFITAAELLYGAKRSARRPENLRDYRAFLQRFSILCPDRQTLEAHSDLRLELPKTGRPIPANDLWQAALALRHEAVLVTSDSHFAGLAGLRVEDWTR